MGKLGRRAAEKGLRGCTYARPVPPPDPLLFGAYFRRKGEDQVTEVFATVLSHAPSLAARLAAAAGLPSAARYVIETQPQADNDNPDLQVRGFDAADHPLWLLWSEHKTESPFSKQQLTRYAGKLPEVADGLPSRLIAITQWDSSASIRAEAAALDVPLLRWRDVVQMAEAAGQQIGGAAWRTTLTADRDAAEPRMLREWLAFTRHVLEEQPVDPLTPSRAARLVEAQATIQTVEDLVEHGLQAAATAIGLPAPKLTSDTWAVSPPAGSWADAQQGKFYADWEVDEEPAVFVAGMWVEGADAEALRADAERLQVLADAGYLFNDDGTGRNALVEITRSLPVADIAALASLDEQRTAVAAFCERVVRALAAGT